MIDCESLINDVLLCIKKSSFFGGIEVFEAYRRSVKPTLMKNAAVAVGLFEMSGEAIALGENSKAGELKIFADVFVPFINKQLEGIEIARAVCSAVANSLKPSGIALQAPYADGKTECMVTRLVFSFNDEFDLGGVDDEGI